MQFSTVYKDNMIESRDGWQCGHDNVPILCHQCPKQHEKAAYSLHDCIDKFFKNSLSSLFMGTPVTMQFFHVMMLSISILVK